MMYGDWTYSGAERPIAKHNQVIEALNGLETGEICPESREKHFGTLLAIG